MGGWHSPIDLLNENPCSDYHHKYDYDGGDDIILKNDDGDDDKGSRPLRKVQFFFNIVQKAFDPPPLLFEHLSYFAGGVF